ncbi:SulP family inorganic anion transporter [Dechloromonas denitrificans]|uniref:SulP family inorganic anion transporter n=1 Tax=Dechloromonas denitrificans TaxID=281362 RepID=UPI001CF86FB0|nr:SulP family inorganic anion transporter [Dechloromonas denitrificans]UCV04682.1 SLC26A/SulP transporter family protein [Dechloromonas denitrificans]UCV09051.1 SLC26A/SulP transporter family protein [Dechloromonas denitrificans]
MQQFFKKTDLTGDFWGGLAAMLVALPAAIAFGVTIYSAISPAHAALGALAGIIGATVIGLIAAILGGTDRLISAPCAPAAAVLSAFAIGLVQDGESAGNIVLMLLLLGILAGLFQVLFGMVGIGRLIKYIPYPVVSGYLTGVGLIIIGSQISKLFGTSGEISWYQSVTSPWLWDWRALAVGAATIAAMLIGPSITHRFPGTILGIVAGLATYFGLATQDASLLEVAGNPLLVGPLGASSEGYFASIAGRWHELGGIHLAQVAALLGSALTLAVLLSIDTLKTCVVLDQMTRSQHEPNRELIAQGVANIASSSIGGIPGAGTMGATLVNLSSGATTRASGVVEGISALVFALLLSNFIAWIPVAVLAGILIAVGLRMIDREPLRFIQSPATVFDFAVVLVVIIVALSIGLIAASAVGVAMAIVLFLREQIGGSVVRHKFYVNQMSSTWHRPEAETRVLEHKGDQAVIFTLQGSLFFGTTQQLNALLDPEIKTRNFIILDMKRVQSVDVTAAHLLRQVRDALAERHALLILSNVHEKLPNGRNLREFLEQTGVTENSDTVRLFPELDSAIEWVEDRLLGEEERAQTAPEVALRLDEMELFKDRKDETLADLEASLENRVYAAGEAIYSLGSPGDAIYLIRRGSVKIFAPLGAGRTRHIATFGRGDFFGGQAFLDGRPRGNDAIAASETEFFVLSLEHFNKLADEHKKLAFTLLAAISRSLAMRLRHADTEIAMLQEY